MDIISIIKELPEMKFSGPVDEEEVSKAENELNLVFAKDYKEYLLNFGFAYSDVIAISGIIDDEAFNVVDLTKKFKPIYKNIPSDFYVIEDVGVDGLVIWQDSLGVIYQSIPNHDPVKIFDNLSDFLKEQI